MNQVFLSFTFKSDAPTFLLFETNQGAQITIEDGQSILPDQIDGVIEALAAIKASIAKKQGNGEGNGQGSGEDGKENNGEAISSSAILPPFAFNTSQKLLDLLGRKVRLMNGAVKVVAEVDCDCDLALEEVIRLDSVDWYYSDGRCYPEGISDLDIIEVLAKGE